MPMPDFYVRIAGDDLVFSAAHFITLGGGACEPLHGHDYRVTAEVYGPLGEEHYVADFVALRGALRGIVATLDHAVLLPTLHAAIRVTAGEENAEEVQVTWEGRRWVFPRADCRLLPLANTTAELLAQHIAGRLWEEIHALSGKPPQRLRIEVAESAGQSAGCELAT
jgi:6-pyruvoyltetrahydropterin/6-carboxytetrahydropterin synthase